jgi:hypothetical protein
MAGPTVPVPVNRVKGDGVRVVAQRLSAHHGRPRGFFRIDITELVPLRGLGWRYGIGVPDGAPGAGSAPSCTRKA